MILTEAFAAGTPVIASNIAGYADVVDRRRSTACSVPPADPSAWPRSCRPCTSSRCAASEMGAAARDSAKRYAWPAVAEQVEAVFERVQDAPRGRHGHRAPRAAPGIVPIDGGPAKPPRKRLSPSTRRPAQAATAARPRGAPPWRGPPAAVGLGLSVIAASRIGLDKRRSSIVRSDADWVIVATALMVAR